MLHKFQFRLPFQNYSLSLAPQTSGIIHLQNFRNFLNGLHGSSQTKSSFTNIDNFQFLLPLLQNHSPSGLQKDLWNYRPRNFCKLPSCQTTKVFYTMLHNFQFHIPFQNYNLSLALQTSGTIDLRNYCNFPNGLHGPSQTTEFFSHRIRSPSSCSLLFLAPMSPYRPRSRPVRWTEKGKIQSDMERENRSGQQSLTHIISRVWHLAPTNYPIHGDFGEQYDQKFARPIGDDYGRRRMVGRSSETNENLYFLNGMRVTRKARGSKIVPSGPVPKKKRLRFSNFSSGEFGVHFRFTNFSEST